MCVSTNRLANQSSGMEDNTPSKKAWSVSFPLGHSKYGAVSTRKTPGGTNAARMVRESVARVILLNAIRAPLHGSVAGSARNSFVKEPNGLFARTALATRFF